MRIAILFLLAAAGWTTLARADEPPRSLDPRLKIELFAEHPQIVTPTGLDVDHRGRVFAIESNTHFPPEGYKGHPTDRVLVMSDTDGDGKADKIVVFKDGLKHSMSVVVRPLWFRVDGRGSKVDSKANNPQPSTINPRPSPSTINHQPSTSIYIATRREIFLFHDDDGDDTADRQESIVHLDTKGDYPHNGLAGFAIDALGWMYFGFGENLGADYKIIGSDGTTLSGGGEGGNIYRCRLDGSKLSQIATGFWNPHASCFDAFGRLFTVDNDADSRPPCRLLHVIPGGDYGYRFRNGRKGLHPFTAWNGEIPGTLPMVAGTGEAPSGILAYESDGLPEEYLGNLLVTSWGDHRIDRFRLQPKGTSFTSLAEPLITGGENFRPVGLATAPDGSLFCTDWVLRDYKLHGHGRIWRIAPKERRSLSTDATSALDNLERRVVELKSSDLKSRRSAANRLSSDVSGRRELIRFTVQLKGEATTRSRIEAYWAMLRAANDQAVVKELRDLMGEIGILNFSRGRIDELEIVFTRLMREPESDLGHSRGVLAAIAFSEDKAYSEPNLPYLAAQSHNSKLVLFSPVVWNEARMAENMDDPFIFRLSVLGNSRIPDSTWYRKWWTSKEPPIDVGRLVFTLAQRLHDPKDTSCLDLQLRDPSSAVRRAAVQWVAEERLQQFRPQVEAIFNDSTMTPDLFLATLAALEMLDGKKPEDFDKTPAEQYVVPLLKDEQRSPAVRAQALRLVSPTDKSLDTAFLFSLLKSEHELLRLETVRTLQGAKPDVSAVLLRGIAGNDQNNVVLRAEAFVGLANVAKTEPVGGPTRQLLKKFLNNSSPVPLRFEALRAARPLIADDAELRDGVLDIAKTLIKLADGEVGTNLADQLALAFTEAKLDPPQSIKLNTNAKPKTRQDWMDQLARGGNVDPAAGRRIFFHPNGPGCFKCHIVDGRGGRVGPDLSRAVGTMNRIQLIQSILEPSREIAPQFVAWTFELHSGKVVTGMVVHENEGKTIVGDAEGKLIELKTIDIAARVPQKISVMPDKLADRMTLQELRDVIAFLDSQR